ncbi:MAG: hypothetical protein JSR33_07555 [Proteobacteria bacterium]|nr:hypothetical protein [Pseudomonadota bacterium]
MRNKSLITSIVSIVILGMTHSVLAITYPAKVPTPDEPSLILHHEDFQSWGDHTRYATLECVFTTTGTSPTIVVNYSVADNSYSPNEITLTTNPTSNISLPITAAVVAYPSVDNTFYLFFHISKTLSDTQLDNTSIRLTNYSNTDITWQGCTSPSN